MSSEEPGQGPPDHQTTTDFEIPVRTAPDAGPARPAGEGAGPGTAVPPAEATAEDPNVGRGVTAQTRADTQIEPVGTDDTAVDAAQAGAAPPIPAGEWTAHYSAATGGRSAAPPAATPFATPAPPAAPPAATPFATPTPPVPPPMPMNTAAPIGGGAAPIGGRRRGVAVVAMIGAVAALAVLIAGTVAFWPREDADPAGPPSAIASGPGSAPTQPQAGDPDAPASAEPQVPSPGAPSPAVPVPSVPVPSAPESAVPGGAPSAEPVLRGRNITYQVVQHDPGYFEGKLVITNPGDRPLRTWKLTFEVPGADVRNIWGGRLVEGGERVEIRNLPDTEIPPGGWWEVRFGAEGSPAPPEKCRLGQRSCGL